MLLQYIIVLCLSVSILGARVYGPASATVGNLAIWDDTTGTLIDQSVGNKVITGDIYVAENGIDIGLEGANGLGIPLSHYYHHYYSTTWTGPWANSGGQTYLEMIGNVVIMRSSIGTVGVDTCTTASRIYITTAIPTAFRPEAVTIKQIPVQNGIVKPGYVEVTTDGQINIYSDINAGSTFTVGQSAGIPGAWFQFSWQLDVI